MVVLLQLLFSETILFTDLKCVSIAQLISSGNNSGWGAVGHRDMIFLTPGYGLK